MDVLVMTNRRLPASFNANTLNISMHRIPRGSNNGQVSSLVDLVHVANLLFFVRTIILADTVLVDPQIAVAFLFGDFDSVHHCL